MKLLIKFLLLTYLTSLVACSFGSDLPIPRPAPKSRLTMLNGDLRSIDDLSTAKPLVLVFWATWCPYSRPFIVDLNELAKEYERVNFVALSVNPNRDYEELRQFIETKQLVGIKHSFSGNEFYDEAYMSFKVGSIPRAFVVDTSGTVIAETGSLGDLRGALESLV